MNPRIEAVHLMAWNPVWWLGCVLIWDFKTPHYWSLKKPMRLSLNSLFMFYPVDIVSLDAEKKILELKEHLRPWTFYYRPKEKYSISLEMPAGSIARLQLRVGQTVDLVDV